MTIFDWVIINKKKLFGAFLIGVLGVLSVLGKDEYDKMTKETKKIVEKKAAKKKVQKTVTKKKEVKDEKPKNLVMVDIKGAVVRPGVYELLENERVVEAIKKAGGLRKDADTSLINLSRYVEDSMVIVVNTEKEIKNLDTYLKLKEDNQKMCNGIIKNDACIENVEKPGAKTNINTASKNELMSLDGIGESKAEAIIKYRKKEKFLHIEDLKKVAGIGESNFDKIKENITI